MRRFLAAAVLCLALLAVPTTARNPHLIAVHFHNPEGAATHAQMVQLVDNLNRTYRTNGSPFSFRFASEDAISLRVGGPTDLNVTISEAPVPWLLGESSLPWDYEAEPWDDYIMLDPDALPGNQWGDVLGHEVGHWLGLLHVDVDTNCMAPSGVLSDCKFDPSQISQMDYAWHRWRLGY